MTDVTTLSNHALIELGGAVLREGERRLTDAGMTKAVWALQISHGFALRAAKAAQADGHVQTFSGDDKDPA